MCVYTHTFFVWIYITTIINVLCFSTGGLVFANVQLSDAQKGRMYKCDIYNTVLRESIGGSYVRVDVLKSKLCRNSLWD